MADTVLVDPEYWIISKNNTTAKVSNTNSGNPVVEVYPNPIVNPFTIYLHDFGQPSAAVSFYNMAGQLIFKQNVTLVNGSEILQPDLRNLSHGKYILKVTAGDFKYVKALLK